MYGAEFVKLKWREWWIVGECGGNGVKANIKILPIRLIKASKEAVGNKAYKQRALSWLLLLKITPAYRYKSVVLMSESCL